MEIFVGVIGNGGDVAVVVVVVVLIFLLFVVVVYTIQLPQMPNPWLRWFRPRHWKVSLTQEVKPAACPKKAQIFSSQNVPSLPSFNPDISPPSVSGPAQLRQKWPKA